MVHRSNTKRIKRSIRRNGGTKSKRLSSKVVKSSSMIPLSKRMATQISAREENDRLKSIMKKGKLSSKKMSNYRNVRKVLGKSASTTNRDLRTSRRASQKKLSQIKEEDDEFGDMFGNLNMGRDK